MTADQAAKRVAISATLLFLLLAPGTSNAVSVKLEKQEHVADRGAPGGVGEVKADLTVNVSTPRGELGSLLFGIFFEEINHAGDGGLYAEMVQNRAFGEDLSPSPANLSLYHSFQSIANVTEGMFLRHCSFQGYVTKIGATLDDYDSSFAFTAAPGQATSTNVIGLQSLNYPDHYVAVEAENLTMTLRKADGTEDFAAHATFTKMPGLADPSDSSLVSFAWKNSSGVGLYLTQGPICYGACAGEYTGCRRIGFTAAPQADLATFRLQQSNAAVTRQGWGTVGGAGVEIATTQPLNGALPRSLHVHCSSSDNDAMTSICGVSNYGYWGMNVLDKMAYNLSFFASPVDGMPPPSAVQALLVSSGVSLGSCTILLSGVKNWTRVECTIEANGTSDTAELQITFEKADLLINVVSLMPRDLPGGYPFRQDLLEKLQAIKPAFVRFPGGCYVEGDKLANAFRWKPSIGPIHERPGHYNLWGYWSDDGLGFYEYLNLCELLGAEPVWVINNGISHTDEIETADIEPWVQDALDSLEFANGPADSVWGSRRAAMGHVEPFNVQIMAVGNEDCGKPNYYGNYVRFYNEIKCRYRTMRLIANCDLTTHKPSAVTDIYDYHIYTNSATFFNGVDRFDTFPRDGPQIFNSEYAITSDAGTGNLLAAVAEAAWMTGLERNNDIIMMASYAPLFVNVNDRHWKVDAIVYNVSHSYGTPSYWNQVMFSAAAREASFLNYFALNVTTTGSLGHKRFCLRQHRNAHRCVDGDAPQMATSVTMSELDPSNGQQTVFVKISNWGPEAEFNTALEGFKQGKIVKARLSQMSGSDPTAENSLNDPTAISPLAGSATVAGGNRVTIITPQWSVSVLTITFTFS